MDWELYDERPLAGATYGSTRARMLVVGLGGGALCVATPGADPSPERLRAMEAWGEPAFLLATNAYHNLGLASWSARYPEARVVAHPRALPRLRKRLPQLKFEGLEALEAALPDGVRLLCPPGARQGETWISARTADGVAWFVTDGVVNLPRLPSGPLGWGMWLAGFRPGLRTNALFARMFLEDRAAHLAWVREQLARDRPTLFVPAHGQVLRGSDVSERLAALV